MLFYKIGVEQKWQREELDRSEKIDRRTPCNQKSKCFLKNIIGLVTLWFRICFIRNKRVFYARLLKTACCPASSF